MDLTYIPVALAFVYLCAVADWFSRRVLSWRLSITRKPLSVSERSRKHWPVMASDIFNTDSHMIGACSRVVWH